MIINWLPLLYGLLFGLIPPRLLINSECRYHRFDGLWNRIFGRTKGNQRRRRWWKLPLVWIDPVRGYVVAMALSDAFDLAPHAAGVQRAYPIAATLIALFIVLWVQTEDRREQNETLSPSSFLGGMMIALLPLPVGLSAIVLGVATTIAMGRFAAGYVVAAGATAGLGYLFQVSKLYLIGYTVLVATPVVISWLRGRGLVIPVRS